jgi:hypothetical protein
MRDSRHEHEALPVVDCVDNAVVADPDTVVVAAGELRYADRARVHGQRVDRDPDPVAERTMETAERPRRVRVQANLVRLG